MSKKIFKTQDFSKSSIGRNYGWTPDKKDSRDYSLQKLLKVSGPLPSKVDLRPLLSPVVNQFDFGSCTANALTGALEYLQLKELKEKGLQPQEFEEARFYHMSRLFIYYNERKMMGMTDQDTGAQIRDGIKSLADLGVCRETLWPYESTHYYKAPSDESYFEAASHKISDYARITSLRGMKESLASGYPFVFGFMVFESFESAQTAKTGIMKMPKRGEDCLGGHAVCAVGYDNEKQMIIVRNSWGSNWADQGYFYMPFKFISQPRYAEDFWMIRI